MQLGLTWSCWCTDTLRTRNLAEEEAELRSDWRLDQICLVQKLGWREPKARAPRLAQDAARPALEAFATRNDFLSQLIAEDGCGKVNGIGVNICSIKILGVSGEARILRV